MEATIATLLILGAVLLFLETILPGMIAGTIGLICLGAAVVLGYTHFGPRAGTMILIGVLLGLGVGALLWLRFFPDSRVARVFVSKTVVGDIGTDRPELLNQTGTTLTPLRPSGMAMINGQRVDVVSEGSMIDANRPVKVVAVEGLRVVVRAVEV